MLRKEKPENFMLPYVEKFTVNINIISYGKAAYTMALTAVKIAKVAGGLL